ncbi:LysR family transcriptional regulator [Brenneria populi subsp. brevivirga]|uniref:LysR family transcriptional regulator n=1 Tax=Brenneria populi TaxID=1505588 RepID=UPI002E188F77|nr:LysR family transcriptional regulator [Brenneria populi subsp. brevivirga]
MDSTHRMRAILSFVHAVDMGSFAAAARTMGVTSAAVSKNVATLETALGVRLLNRTTRTLSLTDEGGIFLRQARVALEALDAAVDAVAAQRAGLYGRVRISTSQAFGKEQLMPKLPDLLARHPGLSISVDFDDRVVDLIREGYDLGLRGGHIRDSSLITRPVCHLNTILVASSEYLDRHGIPQTVDELRRHRFIARRFLSGAADTWSFQSADGCITTLDPTDTAVLTLSAPEALVDAACDGIGIAQVAVHLAWERLVAGRLKIVMYSEHHPGNYEMVIQYPHRALIAPRVRVVVDYLLEAFAGDNSLHLPLDLLAAHSA